MSSTETSQHEGSNQTPTPTPLQSPPSDLVVEDNKDGDWSNFNLGAEATTTDQNKPKNDQESNSCTASDTADPKDQNSASTNISVTSEGSQEPTATPVSSVLREITASEIRDLGLDTFYDSLE